MRSGEIVGRLCGLFDETLKRVEGVGASPGLAMRDADMSAPGCYQTSLQFIERSVRSAILRHEKRMEQEEIERMSGR